MNFISECLSTNGLKIMARCGQEIFILQRSQGGGETEAQAGSVTPQGQGGQVEAKREPGSPHSPSPRFSVEPSLAASPGTSPRGLAEISLHTNQLGGKRLFSFFLFSFKKRICGTGAEMAVCVYGWRGVCVRVWGPFVQSPYYQSSGKCQVLGEGDFN